MGWFDVDRAGLRALYAGKGRGWIVRELVQNAFDELGVIYCKITLAHVSGTRSAELTVEDDAPEGFYDLRHAWTLFADTRKRADAEKRGRFNFGEKQVLSLCQSAEIITTTGHVRFNADGTRGHGRGRTPHGSIFCATLPMTKEEIAECVRVVHTFIPPEGIVTTINGERVQAREPFAEVKATLQTEIANGDGILRKSRRGTVIKAYRPLEGEVGTLYEMGLPVVETGDGFHYDIGQRVPLTADRDNVPAAFLRDVRAEVLNATADDLTEEEVSEAWVRDAAADERIKPETTRRVADLRYGEKRVVADPNDRLSRDRAIAAGFTVVSSRAMSREEWDRMRDAEAIPSSSALFPTRFGESERVDESELTDDHRAVADLVARVSLRAFGWEARVSWFRQEGGHAASYAARCVAFNLAELGRSWFGPHNIGAQLALIIHELGHVGGGHVDEGYYRALCKIGAALALAEPKDLLGENDGSA